MNARDHADVIEGPEPPVAQLSELEPFEDVPPHLDTVVLEDIRGRLRAERGGSPRGRTAIIAAISAVTAAAAAVALTLWIHPGSGDGGMTAKGAGADAAEVYLDFLIQHGPEDLPHRLALDERVHVGDGVYLRADLNQPGALTFLVEEPRRSWAPLATVEGQPGANDLQRDGKLKVFYVTEAGSHRFAALWSDERPPSDWEPGDGPVPDAESLGEGVEVAWVEIEAQQAGH
jgi:hypothetical protein